MKPSILFLVCLVMQSSIGYCQEKATTESGKKVILKKDGTWEFEGKLEKKIGNDSDYKRPQTSTEKITFNKENISVYFDPKIWNKKATEEANRFQFRHKDGDGYAVIIAERMEVPLETMKEIAISNAKVAAPDAHITAEEKRKVNGVEIIALQIEGTIKGIPFVYFGYYYAGKEGCVQVLNYTAKNLFNEYKNDFTGFLNGLTIEAQP